MTTEKTIAEGFIKLSENTGTISTNLEITGTVILPENTSVSDQGTVQSILDTKVSSINPTFTGSVNFENLNIGGVSVSTLITNSVGTTNVPITFGSAVLLDIYTIKIPFNNTVVIPYTASIVVNEISGVAMTSLITVRNADYIAFRIMKPTFEYIQIDSYKTLLNINCAIMKGTNVIACENISVSSIV